MNSESDGGSKVCGSVTVTDTYNYKNVKVVFIRCPKSCAIFPLNICETCLVEEVSRARRD